MTAPTLVAVAFLLALCGTGCLVSLLVESRAELRHLRKREAMPLDDCDYATEQSVYWHEQATQRRYAEPHFETPEQYHARQAHERAIAEALALADMSHAEHIADALERTEFGPVEAARRGMSLPGAEVVRLRWRGDMS